MQDIKELTLEELKKILKNGNFPEFHAKQIFSWIYKQGISDFDKMSDLPADLRGQLKEKFYHLKIMKKAAPGLLIKASGNVKTLKDVKKAIEAGADIIGTSTGVKIIEEAKRLG